MPYGLTPDFSFIVVEETSLQTSLHQGAILLLFNTLNIQLAGVLSSNKKFGIFMI